MNDRFGKTLPLVHTAAMGAELTDAWPKAEWLRTANRSRKPEITAGVRLPAVDLRRKPPQSVRLGTSVPAGAKRATGISGSRSALGTPGPAVQLTLWSDASHDARGAVAHPFPGFSLSAVHLRPDARGSVRIKSPIRCNRRVRREDTRNCALQPASGWYLPHGIRGRLSRGPASSRVWHRWASGGQCGNHANGICRQHQCTNDHDCGKGRRHDFGGRHIAIMSQLRCTLQNSANGPFTWPWMFDRNAVGWKICPSGM